MIGFVLVVLQKAGGGKFTIRINLVIRCFMTIGGIIFVTMNNVI